MSQLWQRNDELRHARIQVCVVTFDGDVLARNYAANAKWKWPLLIDSERELYQAYSMGRGGWWSIYGPSSIWHYLKLMMVGRMPGRPGSDFRQFGGDVLIDPEGTVQLHYVSTSPHDRPTVDSILEAVNPSAD